MSGILFVALTPCLICVALVIDRWAARNTNVWDRK